MYTIELNESEIAFIESLIVEVPYRLAAPLLKKINEQIKKQKENKTQEDANDESFCVDSGLGFRYGNEKQGV